MNGLGSILGRGLLVLALSGFAVACGDDDGGGDNDHDAGNDGGPTAGHAGGGAGHAGGGAGHEADTGTGVTPEQCEEMAVQAAGPDCLACVCAEGPEETVACDEMCWGLVQCVGSECDGDGSDTACIVAACGPFLGGATAAMAFGPIITQCLDVCAPTTGVDGGADAGN